MLVFALTEIQFFPDLLSPLCVFLLFVLIRIFSKHHLRRSDGVSGSFGKHLSKTAGVPILAVTILIALAGDGFSQGQKSSSIVIHDATGAGNGGESATSNLRSEFKSALEREKPCVETMDDQDIRDAIQDERERALLEGGDSDAALKAIGDRMNANLVMMVKAGPGPGGSTMFTGSVMDTRTGRTVARDIGSGDGGAKQVAESLVRQLGPYLTDNCKPHWTGTINYVYSSDESKEKNDAGAMRTASRNVKRTLTETSTMTATIKATLLPPKDGDSVGSPTARVSHRVKFVFTKSSKTTGELYCRTPGKNPFYKGFAEEYTETTTQLGGGTAESPVFISIDDDGSYTIRVNAPAGPLYGKVETSRSGSSCGDENPPPKKEAQSMPEGSITGTAFDAIGRTNSRKSDTLSGSQNLPDGKTRITWNLRLVRPKGK